MALAFCNLICQLHQRVDQRVAFKDSLIRLGRSYSFGVVVFHVLSSLRDHSYPDQAMTLCISDPPVFAPRRPGFARLVEEN